MVRPSITSSPSDKFPIINECKANGLVDMLAVALSHKPMALINCQRNGEDCGYDEDCDYDEDDEDSDEDEESDDDEDSADHEDCEDSELHLSCRYCDDTSWLPGSTTNGHQSLEFINSVKDLATQQRVVFVKIAISSAVVFKEENICLAAVMITHLIDDESHLPFDGDIEFMHSYVVGKLLGYSIDDIKAFYINKYCGDCRFTLDRDDYLLEIQRDKVARKHIIHFVEQWQEQTAKIDAWLAQYERSDFIKHRAKLLKNSIRYVQNM